MTGPLLTIDEIATQLERQMKSAGFVKDGYVRVSNPQLLLDSLAALRAASVPQGVVKGLEPVAMRPETAVEHIARDMKEGRFPARSELQMVPDIDDAWTRIGNDPELQRARQKLSVHELRHIIRHAVEAERDAALSASPGSSAGADKMWRANLQNAWAAIRMIREAVEEFGPVASLESEDANLLRGPEPVHAAEAIVEALSRVRAALAAAPPQREGLSDQFMEFVDRWTWGNSVTAEEALSCIQHHPILTNWRKRRALTGNGEPHDDTR